MNAMNRRAFLGRSTAMVAASLAPIPKAMALVAPDAPPLRWFAVGNDEFLYPYLDSTMEGAIRQYAIEMGQTVGEQCPECDEVACYEHNDDLDAPMPWIEENSFAFDEDLPVDKDPAAVEWLRHGCNTCCEGCDTWGEPVECYEFDGKALCEECFEIARHERLDRIIGNEMKPVGRETG